MAGETRFNELRLEGNPFNHAHLLITDDQGRRIGYVGSRFVNEIPGASAVRPRTAMGGARQRAGVPHPGATEPDRDH